MSIYIYICIFTNIYIFVYSLYNAYIYIYMHHKVLYRLLWTILHGFLFSCVVALWSPTSPYFSLSSTLAGAFQTPSQISMSIVCICPYFGQVEIDLRQPSVGDQSRLSQLCGRTNQFNTTQLRLSESEVKSWVQSETRYVLAAEVKDKLPGWAMGGSCPVTAWVTF